MVFALSTLGKNPAIARVVRFRGPALSGLRLFMISRCPSRFHICRPPAFALRLAPPRSGTLPPLAAGSRLSRVSSATRFALLHPASFREAAERFSLGSLFHQPYPVSAGVVPDHPFKKARQRKDAGWRSLKVRSPKGDLKVKISTPSWSYFYLQNLDGRSPVASWRWRFLF